MAIVEHATVKHGQLIVSLELKDASGNPYRVYRLITPQEVESVGTEHKELGSAQMTAKLAAKEAALDAARSEINDLAAAIAAE